MKHFNRFLNSAWFYRLTALLFALVLVAYVNSTSDNNTRLSRQSKTSEVSSLTSTKTKTVSVPLQLNINSNKYFVTGYPERVKVKLTGPAALVTATSNTQNFSVQANLKGLSMGKHTVSLRADGINKELSYQIMPKQITVTIAKRKTIRVPVHVKYDAGNLATGYEVGTPTTSVSNVTVTGATDEVDQVAQVIAPINLTKNATSTISETVQLEAQDANGHTVNVVMTPATTVVRIPITSNESSKKVSIDYQPKNGAADRSYSISGDVSSLTAFGTKAGIAKLKDSIAASVDVAGLPVGTTKQQISLTPDISGIKSYSVTTANVTIKVTQGTDGSMSDNAAERSAPVQSSSSDDTSTASSSSADAAS
ncbi:CdaR family protein [Furfurilactobacillus siliginis]|uniref:Cell surface protein n=1 Tax=Furfurilactobacillus siliginis TaxID=348151 RepID=A0A0R2LA42_9LACO|nr:CdaR family protein [Furfurilactobacillus siliginis]KRN96661.1 hypothetical protein IV55_GL001190 [Furfurilactobacillus siliginis]GEK29355.1 cell surface protein [Furfurilactobacillus siliginis]